MFWSSILPLGWHTLKYNKQKHGDRWSDQKCMDWAKADDKDPKKGWPLLLDPCPCTLSQALADFGRFQPEIGCDKNDFDGTIYNRCERAKRCYRAVHTLQDGSQANLCCYDYKGYLLYTGDDPLGSTPSYSHPWGTLPYAQPYRVPSLSYWTNDVMPYLYCCPWASHYWTCMNFINRRPTRDCKGYIPPKHASPYGDTHFITFADNRYTFNGRGEFWLLDIKGDNPAGIQLQGRFEAPPNNSFPVDFVRGTFLTSVVMRQVGINCNVQIEINPPTYFRRLRVIVDGIPYYFDKPETRWQTIPNGVNNLPISIVNNSPDHSNFTIIFPNKVGVQVAEYGLGYLHIIASIPPIYKDKVRGLLGNAFNDKSKDFMPRNSQTPIPVGANLELLHKNFGITWLVESSESFFKYYAKANWNYFSHKDFVPYFTEPPTPIGVSNVTDKVVDEVCKQESDCRYDFKATGKRDVALQTASFRKWIVEIKEKLALLVPSCGILPVTNAVRVSTKGYMLGTKVTIQSCNCDCTLEGRTEYECVGLPDGTAQWSPAVNARCTPNSEVGQRKSVVAAAVAVPVVLIVLGVLIALAAFMIFKKRQKKTPPPDGSVPNEKAAAAGAAIAASAANAETASKGGSAPPTPTPSHHSLNTGSQAALVDGRQPPVGYENIHVNMEPYPGMQPPGGQPPSYQPQGFHTVDLKS